MVKQFKVHMDTKHVYKDAKVCLDGGTPVVEDVVAFVCDQTDMEWDLDRLAEEVEEMDLFDAILFEGITIQRIM